MEIAFRTKALRGMCLSGDAMDKQYGPERGASLRRCLADMRAACALNEVPLLATEMERGTFGEEIAYGLGKGMSIVIRANHKTPPRLPDGSVNWPLVERVLLQQIHCTNE